MIDIRDLSFSYHKETFFEHLRLTLSDGTLTALIGENGAGKSTLLKLVMGSEKADSGNIFLDGENMHSLKKSDIARRLSYFPQSRPTPDMSALDVVLMGRYPYTKGRFSVPEKEILLAAQAMERMNVSRFAERNVRTLSFGERQRVYLAMLLAQDTQNCLFDEPTNFMDVSAKFSMLDALSEMRNNGKCVLCVLHDLSLAMRYADRIIVMKDGLIFADGTPDALYQNGAIEKAFGIRLQKYENEGERTYFALPKK